jgi:hypothetical protein
MASLFLQTGRPYGALCGWVRFVSTNRSPLWDFVGVGIFVFYKQVAPRIFVGAGIFVFY